jgi:hypothetical protein
MARHKDARPRYRAKNTDKTNRPAADLTGGRRRGTVACGLNGWRLPC